VQMMDGATSQWEANVAVLKAIAVTVVAVVVLEASAQRVYRASAMQRR
jgi:hypothetical protein